MKFLFLSLSESLRSKKNPVFNKINELFKESLKFKDELVLFQALKESIDLLVIEEDLRVVFLFDRFEEYIPTVSSQFFTNLRTLRNRAKYKFSVVFSLNRPLEELVDPSILSDFYELLEGNYVYLSLKDEYTTDFRISYIEKITGKKVQAQEFEEILKATGGMGKLVKVSVESLLSEEVSSPTRSGIHETDSRLRGNDIKSFLFAQKRIQNSLVEICRSLLPTEQTYLINSCVIASEAKQSLSKNLPDGKAGIAASPPAPRNDNVIGYLESVGLLKDGKIQIPLFA